MEMIPSGILPKVVRHPSCLKLFYDMFKSFCPVCTQIYLVQKKNFDFDLLCVPCRVRSTAFLVKIAEITGIKLEINVDEVLQHKK